MINKSRVTFLFIALSLMFVGFQSSAQKKTSFLQLAGDMKSGGKNLDSVIIKVFENGSVVQSVPAKENGSFVVVLDLNKTYKVVFSRQGYVPKAIEVNTTVPPDGLDIGWPFRPFKMDLYPDIGGISKSDAMAKPVSRIAYLPSIDDFEYDEAYAKRIREEQQTVLKSAEELKRQQDKARLDSLNRIWSDSIAKIKAKELAAALTASASKAKQDSLARVEAERKKQEDAMREKARQDSTNQAQAEIKRKQEEEKQRVIAEQKEKTRLEAEAKAALSAKALADALRQKTVNDSIARAKAEETARQKAISDSIAVVRTAELKARQKEVADSTQRAQALEKAQKDSVTRANAETRRKAEADSIVQAKATLEAKHKADAEALALAAALEKSRKDSTAKAQAEIKRQEGLVKQKATQDSIAQAKVLADARQKAKQDSLDKAKEEAALRQQQLAEAREKAKQDSITRVKEEDTRKKAEADARIREQTARQVREKAAADSVAKAAAEAKVLADLKAKQKAEDDARLQAEQEKRTRDSVALVNKAQKDKAEADRQAAVLAEIAARKTSMSPIFKKDTTTTPKTPSTSVPKIRESDYQAGITEETITEANRVIYRTVVKLNGSTDNYQKIVYGWGGTFFFKNETSVSQNLFDLEIANARKALGK